MKKETFEWEMRELIMRFLGHSGDLRDVEVSLRKLLDVVVICQNFVGEKAAVAVVVRRKEKRMVMGARRWSAEEEKALLTERGVGWGVKKIGRVHKRTVKAVYVRLKRLGKPVKAVRGGSV